MTNEALKQTVGFWTIAICVFAVLFLSNCVANLVGWFHSQDARGLWPLGLLLYSGLAFIYAVAFSATIRVTRRTDIRFIAIYNGILALLLLLHAYLYYTIEIDWLAVNSHTATLTVFQKIIRSDFTPIAIYSIALVGATIVRTRFTKQGGMHV